MSTEDMKQYYAEWYAKNREKHLNYCKEIIKCECGMKMRRSSLSKHKSSERHKNKMKGKRLDSNAKELIQRMEKFLEKLKKEYDVDCENE